MLGGTQKNIIDSVCSFHFEDIENSEAWGFADRSLLALKTILSSEAIEEESDIKAAVDGIREILSAEHPFTLLGLHRNNVTGNNTSGTDADVREYIIAQINAKITSLETKKTAMATAFAHLGSAEELFSLKLTPKAREILLAEPILSKAKSSSIMAELASIVERVNKNTSLLPVTSAVALLIEMQGKQHEAATRIIKTFKTGYNDKKAAELFLTFISENKSIDRLADMKETSFNSIIKTFGARHSPDWFIKDHPEHRERLVSMDDSSFTKAVAALNDPDATLRDFIKKDPRQINIFGQIDEAQLGNIKLALKTPKVSVFIERHPDKITLFADKNAEQIEKAANALDDPNIARLLNRHPDSVTYIMNLNGEQLANVTKAIESEAIFTLLYKSPEYLSTFASMTGSNLNSIQEILISGKLSFDNYSGQLELILKINDTQLGRIKTMLRKSSSDNSLLNQAIIAQNMDVVDALIDAGVNLNLQDKNAFTPLTRAIEQKNIEAVNALIIAGANLNLLDNYGRTPLIYAIILENIEAVNALINAGADLNLIDKYRLTPLTSAIAQENIEALNALITARADLNLPNKNGFTPLEYAIDKKNIEAVNALIKAGANPNFIGKDGLTPLIGVILSENIEALNALITARADLNLPNKNGWTPLSIAILSEDNEIIKSLVKAGAKLSLEEKTRHADYQIKVDQVITELFKEAIKDNNIKSIGKLLKYYPEFKEKDLGEGITLSSYVPLPKAVGSAISKIINEGSGYLWDSQPHWDRVERILKNSPQEHLEDIVGEASKGISEGRKTKLTQLLPPKAPNEQEDGATLSATTYKRAASPSKGPSR